MTVVRDNPVPPGWYYVYTFGQADIDATGKWARAHPQVIVRSTEEWSDPRQTFWLFEITAPVRWEGPGFLSVAPAGSATTAEDTYTAPDPPVPIDDALKDVGKITLGVSSGMLVAVGVGVGVLYLLRRQR